VVYLNAVFHWLPEKLAPLRGIRRLLSPGGRIGVSTGARDQPNTIQDVSRRVLSREPYRSHPGIGTAGHHVSAEELGELLVATGFEVELVTLEPHSTYHATGEAAIQFAQASSFGNYLGRIPRELLAQAREELVAEFEALRDSRGILQEASRIVAVARKPRASA
jgi:arsenite methyltransferase